MKKHFFIYAIYVHIILFASLTTSLTEMRDFGGFSISFDLFHYIRQTLQVRSTILELGSGAGTQELARYYKMYSVEHDKNWLYKYDTTYIYAPIKHYTTYKWYDVDVLIHNLPKKYDLILIDGPTGTIGRYGFFENLHLFNWNVIMIFDDVQRVAELVLLKDVAKKLNKSFEIYQCSDGKKFGVIKP